MRLLDDDFADAIKITQDVIPFEICASSGKTIMEFLAQQQREEGTSQMTDDRGAELVIHGARFEGGREYAGAMASFGRALLVWRT